MSWVLATSWPGRTLLAACLLWTLGSTAWADIVHLKNGRTLRGDVTYEDDSLVITTRFGSVILRRDEVLRVEHEATPQEQYREKAKAVAPDDVEGHYRLALWCEEQGLKEQAAREARAALAADPEHEGAHHLLGHVRFEGRWVTTEERDRTLGRELQARLEKTLKAIQSAQSRSSDLAVASRPATTRILLSVLTPQIALNAGDFVRSIPSGPFSPKEADQLLTELEDVLSLARIVALSGLQDASHVRQARGLVADYFRASSDAEEARAIRELEALGDVSPEVVAVLAQEGPFYESQPTGERVRIVTVGDDRIEYVLVVPEDYEPSCPYPLLVACHGMGMRGQQFVRRWKQPCLEHGYILVCPTNPYGGRGYGARPAERALVLAAIEDVARTYHVDPDRVFLTGLSAGGYATWDVGLHHADRFAGIIPEAGMPVHEGGRITRYMYLQNASSGLGVLALVGERDTTVRKICEQAVEKLQALGGDASLVVVSNMGHAAYPSENDRVFTWMGERLRNPVPAKLFNRVHHLGQGRSFWAEATALSKAEWDASRPVKLKGTYDENISAGVVYELARGQLSRELPLVRASVSEGNHISISATAIARLTVWLTPRLVDFNRPLRLEVNGTTLWNRPVQADVSVLLAGMKRSWDLGRTYLAALDCDLRAKVARLRGRDGR